jgi:hypothetical protein
MNDVAVTRDSDGRLPAELRAQPAADGSSHEQFADVRPDADSAPPEAQPADPSFASRPSDETSRSQSR